MTKNNLPPRIGTSTIATTASLWTLDDRTFTILPQFNPNPETGTANAAVLVFQCDEQAQLLADGLCANIEFDFQTGQSGSYWSSCRCNCLEEPLKQALGQLRERYLDWYQTALEHARNRFRHFTFSYDLVDGSMLAYSDLIPGEFDQTLLESVFPAGVMMIHEGRRWWISDLYCAQPDCKCRDSLLTFRHLDREKMFGDALVVDYKLDKSHFIREIDEQQMSRKQAEELLRAWFQRKPVWFDDDEMRSRSCQLKTVMARTLCQSRQTAAQFGIPELMPPIEIGRNSPCPCGSGKKYKKCCLK